MANLGNVFILGDSYSTFEGFIPKWCEAYYTIEGRTDNDITKVEQAWWHQLIKEAGAKLLRNCSYSGTTICNTGYEGADCSDKSFIARLDKLIDERYFKENKIDTFFVFGGTNDSWADSPIGEFKYSDWTKEDLYSILPAFCYLLHKISENVSDAKVVCIINTELKEVVSQGLKEVCEKYNIDAIQLEDIDKQSGHPTVLGMKQIKEQVLNIF